MNHGIKGRPNIIKTARLKRLFLLKKHQPFISLI